MGLKLAQSELAKENPDKYLPRADTCFFNLELPNYSSKEVLKKQLLLAISFDNSAIDADGNENNRGRIYQDSGDDDEE